MGSFFQDKREAERGHESQKDWIIFKHNAVVFTLTWPHDIFNLEMMVKLISDALCLQKPQTDDILTQHINEIQQNELLWGWRESRFWDLKKKFNNYVLA